MRHLYASLVTHRFILVCPILHIACVLPPQAALKRAKAWLVGLMSLVRRILSEACHVGLDLVGRGGGRRAARLLLVKALVFE